MSAFEAKSKEKSKKVFVLGEQSGEIEKLSRWLMSQYQISSVFVDRQEQLSIACKEEHPGAILLAQMFYAEELNQYAAELRQQTRAVLIYAPPTTASLDVATLFAAGCDEVLLSSMTLEERGARLMNQLQLHEKKNEMCNLLADMQAKHDLIVKRNDELELLAKADPITGLYNRRYMLRKLQEEAARNQRSRHSFSVLICDLDHFSALNDREGRDAGDRVLQEIGLTLTNSCRSYDVVARWGADQYLLMLPETDLTWALVVAERCRRNVSGYTFKNEDRLIDLSITIGVTEFRQLDGVGGCMRRAEQALKEAKQRKRDSIVFCDMTDAGLSFQTYAPQVKVEPDSEV